MFSWKRKREGREKEDTVEGRGGKGRRDIADSTGTTAALDQKYEIESTNKTDNKNPGLTQQSFPPQ